MRYQTDRQRVTGLGTAHEGAGHWWSQRLTAIALALLTIFFVFPLVRALGADWVTVQAIYARPLNAVVAILFFLVGFLHLQQGIQVVIEDYVQDRPVLVATLVANKLICWGLALTGVFAVAKLAFVP